MSLSQGADAVSDELLVVLSDVVSPTAVSEVVSLPDVVPGSPVCHHDRPSPRAESASPPLPEWSCTPLQARP
ncbi:MAG: hypothetical protein R3F14_32345 [Polyangiaceae bacterium]